VERLAAVARDSRDLAVHQPAAAAAWVTFEMR
jgi:hypothetical protein